MAGRRRRIMRAFKMDEISVVDRPAQAGAVVAIMKRDASADCTPAGATEEHEMTTDIQSAGAIDLHREAGAVLDDITEKHRADGESYADACQRLSCERSDAGEEYRKAVRLADRLHRQAQETAAHLGQKFTVTKRYPGNACEVEVRKSAAEQEMDRLAAELHVEDPSLDYYSAYAKAAAKHPEVYQQAVRS